MANFGKSLEAAARKVRLYLSPANRRAFRDLRARGLNERLPNEPMVCFDFSNSAIDAVGGRYYFSLVRDLIDAGYFPVFTAQRATLSTFGTSAMKSPLLKERLGVVQSLDELKQPYLLITDGDSPAPENAQKVVRVRYERRRSQNANEVEFPVFVHPWLTSHIDLPYTYDPNATRPVRLFFGGNTEERKYDQDVLRELYGMLTRREMIEQVSLIIPPHRPSQSTSWIDSTAAHPFLLCETQHCKIPQERWLDALAKADFFLACPGVGMPLCHNLIEALAAGSIPILQYAAYLPCPLQDGINCLTFTDEESLRTTIKKAKMMSQEEILILRENVRQYHDDFLAPGRFSQLLLENKDRERILLINAYRVPR